ncbi:MAG: ABC transporter permease [Clostridia bacterium]|nr:ABC transporter permease [Clostridia bacterium]
MLAPVLGVLALLLLWALVCSFGGISPYVLPSPGKVGQTFLKMVRSGEIARDVLVSFGRVIRGFGIAFLLAFALAVLRIALPASARFTAAFIQFFRSVPPISLIPLLILWCGIGEQTKTIIIILAAFFPMYLAIVKGFTSYDPKLLEMAHVFSYSPLRIFLRILLPSAVPDILLGMRTSLGYAWRAIIGAEMVAASTGLGHMILFAQQMSRTDKVIVGILVIGIAGSLTDWLLGRLIHRLVGRRAEHGWD